MPRRLRFVLSGQPPAQPWEYAIGLRTKVLEWIGRASPELACEYRRETQPDRADRRTLPKPYTISPIWCDDPTAGRLSFDISTVKDDLADILCQSALEG